MFDDWKLNFQQENFVLKFYFSTIVSNRSTLRKGKDPDLDQYLWLKDPDADPGGPKTHILRTRVRITVFLSYGPGSGSLSFCWIPSSRRSLYPSAEKIHLLKNNKFRQFLATFWLSLFPDPQHLFLPCCTSWTLPSHVRCILYEWSSPFFKRKLPAEKLP